MMEPNEADEWLIHLLEMEKAEQKQEAKTMKKTMVSECDECSRKFRLGEVVYFCVWDGATVCPDCRDATPALKSAEKEERVYEGA